MPKSVTVTLSKGFTVGEVHIQPVDIGVANGVLTCDNGKTSVIATFYHKKEGWHCDKTPGVYKQGQRLDAAVNLFFDCIDLKETAIKNCHYCDIVKQSLLSEI